MYMKLNNDEINKELYSTKEAITYFLLGYYNTKSNNILDIIKSIEKQMKIVNKDKVLDNYYCQYLTINRADLKLTKEQIISYSYIVGHEISKCQKRPHSFEIICIFNKILEIFTPEQAERKLEMLDI